MNMTYRSMICGLALAMAVWAQGPGTPPAPPTPTELKAYLGLSDSQIQALQQIRQQEAEALRTIHDELAQKQKTLGDQLQAGSTDAAALGRLLLDIQNLRKRIEDAQKSFRDQAANQLTAEQKTKLKALEEAAKLQPAIGQATGLNLLVPSTPAQGGVGFGPRGPGGMAPRGPGMGPMGFGGRRQ